MREVRAPKAQARVLDFGLWPADFKRLFVFTFLELSELPARITNDNGELIVRSEAMTVPTTSSDAELLRLMAAGSEDAFVTLYRRHVNRVYRFALQMSGSPSLAEDVTQEVF